MSKYRFCSGLAIYPDKDMRMLEEMSSKGWHLTDMKGILYKFEKGEEKAYSYNLNMENEINKDMLSLYKQSGWEPVIFADGYQIYRAEKGTTPIFTDNETKVEVLEKQKVSFGIGAIIFLIALIASITAVVVYDGNPIVENVILLVSLICWIGLVFWGLPYLGLRKQIKKL